MPETPSEDHPIQRPEESEHAAKSLQRLRVDFALQMLRLREKHLIENPSPQAWPRYPLLCLIHRRERDEGSPIMKPGLIHASEPTTVVAVNLFDLPAYGGAITGEELKKRMVKYASVDSLLEDWQVD